MTVNSSRSQRQALLEGATDGKYRKARPNTEVVPGLGVEQTLHNRSHLHPNWNYDYIDNELLLAQREVPAT